MAMFMSLCVELLIGFCSHENVVKTVDYCFWFKTKTRRNQKIQRERNHSYLNELYLDNRISDV